MGRLVTKPFHSDDVITLTNRPIPLPLKGSHVGCHVVGSRKGMSRKGCHTRVGDCRQSNTPFFKQQHGLFQTFEKKVYKRERMPTRKRKGRRPFFQTAFVIFSQALSNRMYISSLKAVSLYCCMNCLTPASCLFLMRFNTICMAS